MTQPNQPFSFKASLVSDSDYEDSDGSSVIPKTNIRRRSRHYRPRSRLPTVALIGCCAITGWFLSMASLYTFMLLSPEPDVFHPETLKSGLNLCDCGANIKRHFSAIVFMIRCPHHGYRHTVETLN